MLTEQDIDGLTASQLNWMVALRIFGWLPPTHPETVKQFFLKNPARKRYKDDCWYTGTELVYGSREFSGWLHQAWDLSLAMLGHKDRDRARWFERMLLEGRLYALPQKECCEAVCRAALKAHLLPVPPASPLRPSEDWRKRFHTKKEAILKHYTAALKDGPLRPADLVVRLSDLCGFRVEPSMVYSYLRLEGLVVGRPVKRKPKGRSLVYLSLPTP